MPKHWHIWNCVFFSISCWAIYWPCMEPKIYDKFDSAFFFSPKILQNFLILVLLASVSRPLGWIIVPFITITLNHIRPGSFLKFSTSNYQASSTDVLLVLLGSEQKYSWRQSNFLRDFQLFSLSVIARAGWT